MASKIQEPSLRSVGELLTGEIVYRVPIHQRSFDWGQDEVEELWEDICMALTRPDEEYYLGTIVLRWLRDYQGDQAYDTREIIDGQQRLACISMVFSAIRNAFASRNDERQQDIFRDFLGSKGYELGAAPRPKLTLNEINDETYRKFVVDSLNRSLVTEALKDKRLHPSNRKLLEAYAYLLDKLNDRVGPLGTEYDEFLVPLINCLKGRVRVIVIPVEDEEAAYLVFESVNARGKELAVSDLVKNRLYYEVGQQQVARAKNLWDRMGVDLGTRPIPEYLRHYWIAKRADPSTGKVREKALYRQIVRSLPSKAKRKEAMKLVSDLSGSASKYAMISDYTLWPDNQAYGDRFKGDLQDLQLFRVRQCYPVLLNVIEEFTEEKEIAGAFKAVASFSFRYNIIGSGTSGSLESIFAGMAHDIRVGSCRSAKEMSDQLRGISSDAQFRADFELAVLSKRKARIARYILVKIENYLRAQKQGTTLARIDPEDRRMSLEHILPQNEQSHAQWKKDFGPNLDPADYIYRIGNLTLATASVNRASADKSFSAKKAQLLAVSGLLIDDHSKEAAQWGNREIEQRQSTLAKHALQVWKL
jgi:hypothetical protein